MSIVHVAFYPSDWLAGTRGLSDAETGVYITLIARMYEMAAPIERDDNRLARLCGCKSRAAFVKALEYLISEGKIIEGDGALFNERVEKEIEKSTEKSSKAKAAAQSRWERKPNKNNGGTDANASPKHMPQRCQPEPEPYIREDTNVSLSDSSDIPRPANDLSKAVSRFNAVAERAGWPAVQKLNPNRSKQLRARISECGGLEGWEVALRKAFESDFCRGKTQKPWTGFGFDWLIKAANFTKLMEGNYDNRDCQNGSTTHAGAHRPGSGMAEAFAAVAERRSREYEARRGGGGGPV